MAANAPKEKEQRRRSAPPTRGEWVDLVELDHAVIPELPENPQKWAPGMTRAIWKEDEFAPELLETWSVMTRTMWESWREDPVTSQWSPSDITYAMETILIREKLGNDSSKLNEIRLRMDSLGLTPKGKRDLRWRNPHQLTGEETTEEAKEKRKASAAANDRRARLSIVKT